MPVASSVVLLGVVIAVGGALIAPILASAYAMVDDAAPAGTITEAFAWIATASAVGSSAGAALAGAVVDTAPAAGFLVAGGAAVLAALLTIVRSTTLATPHLTPRRPT